jgi:hypothetical protein
MGALDTTTFHPLALLSYAAELREDSRTRVLAAIESFLVRRMLSGLTIKAYTRMVVDILGHAHGRQDELDDVVVDALAASAADTSRWPTDEELVNHLARQPLYKWIGQAKIRLVLSEIELARRQAATVEDIFELPKLSIEHIMPREWARNWPLPDGDHEALTERRNSCLNLLGNLTLVTGNLNSSLSNQAWTEKRVRLGESSILLLNRELAGLKQWDEQAVALRGSTLAGELCSRWPGPAAFKSDFEPPSSAAPPGEVEPERASMSVDQVQAAYTNGTELFQSLLDELARDREPRTLGELAEALGWMPGRLSAVLASYTARAKDEFGGLRPYRTNVADGTWWMWLDRDTAEVIRSLAGTAV